VALHIESCIVLTDKGTHSFDAAMRLQAPWISGLADGLLVHNIETVHRLVLALRKKLEGSDEPDE
jgi:hypothetical protein